MKTSVFIYAGLIALTIGLAQTASAQPTLDVGQRLAVTHCGACHAVDRQGDSPNPRAPRFRDLGPPEGLRETLAQGMIIGHPQLMPKPVLTRQEVDDLIAYMKTLEQTPGRAPRESLRPAG
jgi:mono/diheme cytochrome c family protein